MIPLLRVAVALCVGLALTQPNPVFAQEKKLSRGERKDRIRQLGEKYRQFLVDVDPIILPEELDTFLRLESDAQRDLYIDDFWKRRDAANGLSRNAYRDRYYARIETAKEKYKSAVSDRGKMFIIHGPADEVVTSDDWSCRFLQPMEVWTYNSLPQHGRNVRLIFYQPRNGVDYRLWLPLNGTENAIGELLSTEIVLQFQTVGAALAHVFGQCYEGTLDSTTRLECRCPQGAEIVKSIHVARLRGPETGRVFDPPPVNKEDVKRVLQSVVLPTPGATNLSSDFSVAYPPTTGNRADAQMTILVPRSQLVAKETAGVTLYSVDVTGEILKDDQLFESYRYRFDFPADVGEKVPIVIDRMLPEGTFRSRIRIADFNSKAEAIVEQTITVPGAQIAAGTAPSKQDEIVLRIVPLPDELLHGQQHVATITSSDVAAVEFYLDGRKIMTKRTAPFALDVDLGDIPKVHRIGAVALTAKGESIGADEAIVNAGNDPFRVRIVSPRVASKIRGRTRVEVSVAVPEDRKLKQVELFVNETRVATLYAPPFVHTVEVPESVGYLRAVATLDDPTEVPAEDAVIFNAPSQMEQVTVHLVELPTTVVRDGRPANDLPQDAFRVLDEGREVKIAKFEHVRDLPLSIGLAIDTSTSMRPRLADAQKAAAQFLSGVMKPGDKAFVMSFDVRPQIVQRWSSDFAAAGAALARLRTAESTALYDAIVYSLYSFLNVKSPKALIVLSDGQDTSSKFTFDQTLEYARRSGVPIYAIGVGIPVSEVDVRYHLGKLSGETGGNAYFIDQATDLARIYATIQEELRSQYILGFYPPGEVKAGSKWRAVSVEVRGAKAKTVRGYYP